MLSVVVNIAIARVDVRCATIGTLMYASFLTAPTAGRRLGPAVLDRFGQVIVPRTAAAVAAATGVVLSHSDPPPAWRSREHHGGDGRGARPSGQHERRCRRPRSCRRPGRRHHLDRIPRLRRWPAARTLRVAFVSLSRKSAIRRWIPGWRNRGSTAPLTVRRHQERGGQTCQVGLARHRVVRNRGAVAGRPTLRHCSASSAITDGADRCRSRRAMSGGPVRGSTGGSGHRRSRQRHPRIEQSCRTEVCPQLVGERQP